MCVHVHMCVIHMCSACACIIANQCAYMCAVHAMDVYTTGKGDGTALKSYTTHFMIACPKERGIYTHSGS